MALHNTLNFLPRVFRTVTNQRFLGATMDQLAADSANVPVNGYVGRTFAPTYKTGDNYVPESDNLRKNYQLEPSVVITDDSSEVVFNTGYIDLLKNIENYGGIVDNQQRLFSSESYSYDGRFDFDKFVNYYNYYWLPNGPATVNVYSNQAPYTADFTVTRSTAVGGYTFTGTGYQPNTQLTLVRGGTYTFQVNQPGSKFWIQRSPGVSGVDLNVNTLSTRDVFGVYNNGEDNGTVTFKVPLFNAQDFYILLPITDSVDAATKLQYGDIQNRLLSDFLTEFPDGLDGINNQLQNKSFLFIGNDIDDVFWVTPPVDSAYTDLDVATIRPGDLIEKAARTATWKINLVAVDELATDYIIQISPQVIVQPREKVFISSGKTYASNQFWLNDTQVYNTVPAITANMEYLYYQDESNPGFVGEIKLIDNISTKINVEADVIGKVGYTAPNGVVFTNGLKIRFDSLVTPDSYANNEYYVDGVGTAISLIPVSQTLVAESFADDLATQADYITINRGSRDRNSWSRSNRWFHKDVIAATASYNISPEDYGPNLPGRRPIIEFDPNLQLFNYGKQGKDTIDLITFESTDAFGVTIPATRVEGQISAVIDGVTLVPGQRIVFANDYDINVKNKIWIVTLIEGLSVDLVLQDYINLIPSNDNPVQAGENVLVTGGTLGTGHTYRFDGTNWFECQPKTALNQAPLFDIVDKDGYSFSDTTIYPGSTFDGNKIFSYYPAETGNNDTVLGFPLRYQNFNNIGDIVFKNHYDSDTHTYVSNTTLGTTSEISCDTGYLVKNLDLTTNEKINIWVKGIENSSQYQLFTKFFDGRVIAINGINRAFVQIDVLPDSHNTVPHLKVFKNNALLVDGTDYELTKYGEYNIIVLLSMPAIGDKLDVAVFGDEVSSVAFYEVPKNLDQNPLNEKFLTIALGQIRTHYNKLIENTSISNRPIHDSYIRNHTGTLSQHSAPLVYAMTFLNDPLINFVNGLDLAKKEYSRFKNKFISLCSTLSNLDYNDPISGVDTILQNINAVKNSSFPWYYSDMVPQGGNFNTITYTVLNARQSNYEISSIFDNTQLSNRAVLIWLNGNQLVLNKDYTFSNTVPVVTISADLVVGDIIVIRDYFNTDGNFIPETPSKLGLYPKSEPAIYQDTTYQTPIDVIRGHDGSLTPTFGDFRDNYLLELEKRIYNNIKSDYSKNIINLYDVVPGRFRTTEYSREEFVQILSKNFLQWSGANNVDYTTNSWYNANNPWTWNYNEFTDTISDSLLQGSWRAIYNYWYDTDQPNLAPWQMLGFGFKPSWWETRYGPAPYTKGNFTLWEDLEAGYIWNNGNSYTDARFARPGLTNFIPVDSAGNLLPPTEINIVKQYNLTSAGNSFAIGEQSPVETAWRRSSDYPFAVQMTLAMCKPASYFGTQYDISRFYVNDVSTQFTDVDNQRIHPLLLAINGEDSATGTVSRTSGYINWIADALKNVGIDPVEKIQSYLSNLTVKLNYKVAGFTDKNTLTVTAEQTAPGTTRAGVIIPDSNYDVYLNKSVPVSSLTYSAVIVQKTATGYSITGYDTSNPFFTILPSVANSNAETLVVDDVTVKLYQNSDPRPIQVAYGTTYATSQQVADFLISYERYLEQQGFRFNQFDADLQEVRNFRTSVKEFVFWTQQGWDVGTLIILNPAANLIAVKSTGMIVDEIMNVSTSGKILDQNFLPIKSTNFNILRTESPVTGNMFRITTLNGSGICLAHLKLIQYEHVLVFDNETDFGDIIYIPSQGVRQYRLRLSGTKTGQWTGALSAAGYIYSNSKVAEWQPGVDYQVGDIVTFNNNYYTALNTLTASSKFDVSSWAQIQEQDIKTGLLPSFGQQAQQFDSIYNIDQPPNNESLQLFSAGLIGFRPRSYLTDLGISIPNQTKFYQGYIKEKGTINSITALTKASFNNVSGAIEVFEEWGFKVGDYGDLDGNQFKEFILDQSIFNTNPVAFTSTTTHSTGNIIVNLNGNTASHFSGNLTSNSDVYNASNLLSTSTTIYSNRTKEFYTTDLPNAGFVHLDDVDLTIFDITTYGEAPEVSVGSKIWVAKDSGKQWNVYRATETNRKATQITYVLDNYAQIDFDGAHGLVVGDLFVLSGFDIDYFNNTTLTNYSANFDSTYEVIEVVDSNTVTIQIKNANVLDNLIATSPVVAEADVYKLVSMRLPTMATISTILPPSGWITNDRVWVDTDVAAGATGWAVYTYNGSTWVRTRQQSNTVDVDSINRTFIYNKTTNDIIAAVDIVDPVKGKVLSTVSNDVDYRLDYDPATYNAGTVNIQADRHWGPDQIGRIWWNLDSVRYINYEQDALIYRLNHWGEQFPGSNIDVYEWVESAVLPSEFVASGESGVPLYSDDSAYSTYGYVDQSGTVKVKYYFWVGNRDQANTRVGKQNSVIAITSAIENPQNQNIPYATVLRDDTIALYNVKNLLVGQNSILHLGSQSINAGLIHSEYALVQEKSANSQLPANIVNKIIDSLAEIDRDGNLVPDPNLPVSQRYGVEIRPRQTMFVDLQAALVNIITLVNKKLYNYPVTQRKVLTLLNSEEPAPGIRTGTWLTSVDNKTELGYIDTADLPTDGSFKVLVNSDPAYLGKWSIYAWDGVEWSIPADGTRLLANGTYGNWVQSYKTNLYWTYEDWYATDFDPTTSIDITVDTNLDFGKLILTPDTYIKVLNAGNDKFAIYYIDANLDRITVGLQDGTIQLPGAETAVPGLELRQILLSLQHEIFIDDLAQDFNEIFFAMIKYALTEQKNLDWAFKTSFISATQYIRKLEQFPSYISDNQDFFQSYIDEVKPYRTILREFNINYQRNDEYGGDVTDFDLAPYWDSNINVYRSPSGEQSYDTLLLNNQVYRDWKNNYTYGIVEVTVGAGGTGYILPPQIIISGGGGTGANAVAQINEYGQLANITIVNPGSGYTSTPTVIINGTGTGAIATPVLRNVFDNNDIGHNVIRSIRTNIKFDRITYDYKRHTSWGNAIPESRGLTNANAIVMWDEVTSGQVIAPYTIINVNDTLYQLTGFSHTVSAGLDFPLANVTTISAANLTTANDRIVAYNGNIDLSATAEGIDYPGVVVDGSNYFAYDSLNSFTPWTPNTLITTGTTIQYSGNLYEVNGNVYGTTFSSIESSVSLVTGTKIDTIIQSRYSDDLGIDSGNIYVDGGAYVDRFSSHAPEELIPGRMFDSLNLKVFSNTAPGTNDYAFRLFDNMSGERKFYRISNAQTTTLARDLLITDDKIFVADATKLPQAGRALSIPGSVFINGEKIVYYRNYALDPLTPWASNTTIANDTLTSFGSNVYLVNGNVFATNIEWQPNTVFAANSYIFYSGNSYQIIGNARGTSFSSISANLVLLYNNENSGFASITNNLTFIGNTVNVLGQIRRAVDGTGPAVDNGTIVHRAGARVVDSSLAQEIPISTATNVLIASTTTRNVTSNVSLKIRTSGNITANVGDFIVQKFANATVAANLRVLGNVVGAGNIAVIKIGGNITSLSGNTISVVQKNGGGTTTTVYGIISNSILGTVNNVGNITITTNTYVATGNIWYGNTTAYYYGGNLKTSTTEQATFLTASPGYVP